MIQDRYTKFWILVVGILFFFGCHNYMQELIMSLPGFNVRYELSRCKHIDLFAGGVDRGVFRLLGSTRCRDLLVFRATNVRRNDQESSMVDLYYPLHLSPR